MGYRRERKVYRLNFEGDPEMDGLVVKVRSTSIGNLLQVAGLLVLADRDVDELQPDDIARLDQLFDGFAGSLVEWNLEDEQGTPVPATPDGVKGQDADFILPIVKAWFTAMNGVPTPLGAPSSDGGRSLERSIPMESPSVHQAS